MDRDGELDIDNLKGEYDRKIRELDMILVDRAVVTGQSQGSPAESSGHQSEGNRVWNRLMGMVSGIFRN